MRNKEKDATQLTPDKNIISNLNNNVNNMFKKSFTFIGYKGTMSKENWHLWKEYKMTINQLKDLLSTHKKIDITMTEVQANKEIETKLISIKAKIRESLKENEEYVNKKKELRELKKSGNDTMNLESEIENIYKQHILYNEQKKLEETLRFIPKDQGSFVAAITKTRQTKDGTNVPSKLKDDIIFRTMLTIDIDEATPEEQRENVKKIKNCAFMYSTFSYTPEKPKIRIIIPLLEPLTPDEFINVSQNYVELLELKGVCESSHRIQQIMYFPACPADITPWVRFVDGPLLDGKTLITETEDEKPFEFKEKPKKTIKLNGKEKTGPIGAFCRTYSITDVLENFLYEFYEKGSIKNRYTYIDGSTQNGVLILDDDSLCISWHSTDPAGDGHQYNSFDLITKHLHNNDLNKAIKWCAELDEVKQDKKFQAEEAKKEKKQQKNAKSDDWPWDKNHTKYTQYDMFPMMSISNLKILLEKENIEVKYNEMTKDIELNGERIEDRHDVMIKDFTQLHKFVGANLGNVRNYLDAISYRNPYHPVKIYLDSLKPINELTEFNKLCDTLKFENDEVKDFSKLLIKKWLISGVAAIYNTAFRAQGVLVLQGEGGIMKSTWLSRLIPIKNAFKGEFTGFNAKDKDQVKLCTKHWVTELAELESTFGKDYVSLKGFITAPADDFRAPFDHREKHHKRRTILCGSVNSPEFLRDETGNRRYWSIAVKSINMNTKINRDIVWCEIKNLYLTGEKWFFNEEEGQQLNEINTSFETKTIIDDILTHIIDFSTDAEKKYYKTIELLPYLTREGLQLDKLTTTKIGTALSKLGFKPKSIMKNGVRNNYRYLSIKKIKKKKK